MVRIANPRTTRRQSEWKLATVKPPVQIPKGNVHRVDLKWTEDEQAKLQTLVERFTPQGASGACRVHRWWLGWFSLVLGETGDRNDISTQWYDE
jgi:hypothetical protein